MILTRIIKSCNAVNYFLEKSRQKLYFLEKSMAKTVLFKKKYGKNYTKCLIKTYKKYLILLKYFLYVFAYFFLKSIFAYFFLKSIFAYFFLHLRTFKMPILDLIIFRVISEIFFKYFVNSYR